MDSRIRRMGLSEIRPRATISTRASGGFALLLYEFPSGRSISAICADDLALEAIGHDVAPSLTCRKIAPARDVIIKAWVCDVVHICEELGHLEVSFRVLHGGLEVHFAVVGGKPFQPQACVVDVPVDEVDCVHEYNLS